MTLYTVDSVHIQVQILPVVVIFHLLVINVVRLDSSPRGSLLRPVGSSYLVTHSLQKVFQMRPIVFPRNEFRGDSNDMGTKTHLPAALASTAQVSRVEISFDLRSRAIRVWRDQLMHAWCSLDESLEHFLVVTLLLSLLEIVAVREIALQCEQVTMQCTLTSICVHARDNGRAGTHSFIILFVIFGALALKRRTK